MARKKRLPEDEEKSEEYIKTFFDRIAPSAIRFYPEYYICGNTLRCVWAIREYSPVTTDQALLAHLGDREGITLHLYLRTMDGTEQRQILQHALRKNNMMSFSGDMQESTNASGNLEDVAKLLEEMRKSKETLVHCAVYMELCAGSREKLQELQSDVLTELTRNRITIDRLLLRQKEGFLSCMPCGYNLFGKEFERVLPSGSAANLYPFAYSGKTDPQGFYIGRDRYGTNVVVDFDRRAGDKTNSNILILGNSGQGKSYLLKLILTNLRMAGKSVICLDAEQEYTDLTNNLGGCCIDLMNGVRINPLEPKAWAEDTADFSDNEKDSPCPEAFRKTTRLSQHISFLKDFFRAYKDFPDAHLDAIEILLTMLYARFGINDKTEFSSLAPEDYPIMSDLYKLAEEEYRKYEQGGRALFTEELLREICLALHSMCVGAESKFFNGHTNVTDSKFLTFSVKGLMDVNKKLRDAVLFNILSYMSHRLLNGGNSVASIDEAYMFLSNMTAIEYIRNAMKRVRKKNSSVIIASQNVEDFLIPGIREYTKPLFSIPTHQFIFYPGSIAPKDFTDALQMEESEYNLIRRPERGSCLFRCGSERYLLQVDAPEYKARLFGDAGGR